MSRGCLNSFRPLFLFGGFKMDIEVVPEIVNLTIYRGDDVDVLVKVKLPKEFDISGISFAMSIRFNSWGVMNVPSEAFDWEAGSEGEAGRLLIKLSGDLTAPITQRAGSYDLQAQFAGRRLTLCRGSLTIIPDITK